MAQRPIIHTLDNTAMTNTEKLITELKKHTNVEYGKVSTSTDGKEQYRYVFYKLKYPHADNYLVRMFMKASTENTGKDYHTRFESGNYSFTYDRPQFKGQKNGTMTMRYLEIMDDENSKYKRGGQTKTQSNKIEKVMHEFKQGTLRSSNGKKVTNRTQAIAIALSEAGVSQRFDEGGVITQQEIQAMKSYIESEDANEFLKNSFGKVLKKYNVDLNNLDVKKYPLGKPTNPYGFYGNTYMEDENKEQGVKFLLTGEYPLVAKAIYEKDYSMWLFYNYLGRINISYEACEEWLKQAQNYFADDMPMPLKLIHTPLAKDGRSYATYRIVGEGKKSFAELQIEKPLTYSYKGRYYYNIIGMVGNYDAKNSDGWGTYYKERKTGLLIPEFTKTSFHFNTLIHEFAHCYDFQTQSLDQIKKYEQREREGKKETRELSELEKKIYGKTLDEQENDIDDIIANHFDLFVDGLIKILRACASGKIPITQLFEQQAMDVQTALGGVYGDLLLEQRERKRREEAMQNRADEVRDNERFTWQGKKIPDVLVEYIIEKSVQDGLKERLSKGGAKQPFTMSEIIELDNLINLFIDTKYRSFMVRYPSKAPALLESMKAMKVESNRIINNHYDNIRNKFTYGFYPKNDLDVYLMNNCDIRNFKDYKSWKECAKTNISDQTR